MLTNGTPASPATALARRVFPVPGGPCRMTPLGIRHPFMVYAWGCFRKSTISASSNFAPSHPATSANVMFVVGWKLKVGFILAKVKGDKESEPFLNKRSSPEKSANGTNNLCRMDDITVFGEDVNLEEEETEMSTL
mmetsp:Transcript_24720/g.51251  ORF Transcript_24720/g.51251 Transcript_24720/m.51251 type:complete len:136 (-) Transcript_24720:763-1170(-)